MGICGNGFETYLLTEVLTFQRMTVVDSSVRLMVHLIRFLRGVLGLTVRPAVRGVVLRIARGRLRLRVSVVAG